MKNNKNLQTVLLVTIALILGFIAGGYFNFPKTNKEDLAGTIGQVDRYRNVKISENDIKLRNSLVDDTTKRQSYKTYLQYHYYKAVRTSKDIENALSETEKAEDFIKKSNSSIKEMKKYNHFLRQRRVDVMEAMRMVANLDKDEDVPVIGYLNNANDFISRMKVKEKALISFNEEIKDYVENHQGQEAEELKNAHDIISTNLYQSAMMTDDKPVKAYLKKDGFLNNAAGLKALWDGENFQSFMQDQLVMDAEKLGFKLVVGNKEELAGSCMLDMGTLGLFDAEKLGDAALADKNKLQMFSDAENLGDGVALLDVDNLQAYLSFDSEKLGFIVPLGDNANIMGSNEALRASLMDAEKVGFKAKEALGFGAGQFDAEMIGLLVLLNDNEQLGAFAFDAASLGLYTDAELLGLW